MNRNILILLSGIATLTSCVKGINNPTKGSLNAAASGTTTATVSGTTTASSASLDLIKDSVYLYTKEDYFWADAIPAQTTFVPRSYSGSSDLGALQSEVFKLSQYKINPSTSLPYEYVSSTATSAKYFYMDAGQTTLRLNAVSGDFGFGKLYNSAVDLRVSYVTPGSPADLAGLTRGSQITSINGNTSLNYDGVSGTNTTFIANAYASSTIVLGVTKPDGTKANYTLNAAIYTPNPVLKVAVINQANGKKTGYIVFNSFITLASAQPKIDAAFTLLSAAGISDLVVDLRYNGGGYTETAQYLINKIAPSATSGNTMFTANYNSTLQNGQQVLLKQQIRKDATGTTYNYGQVNYSTASETFKFGSTHPLNLSRVFFLVTGATASSSEITINSLRPYMNVQLVGATTYGKPIGFIDIDINKYFMYLPAFEIKNSAGFSDYYNGMTPGTTNFPGFLTKDDLTHDFGDSNEGLLSAVVNYINNGVYKSNSVNVGTQSIGSQNVMSTQELRDAALALDNDQFKGMMFQYPKHK